MEQEKTGLQFDQSPYYIRIKKDKTIEVYKERVTKIEVWHEKKTIWYEKKGVIRKEAFSTVRGLIGHAVKAAGHKEHITEGNYGLTEEWGIKILLIATALHGFKNHQRAGEECDALADASPVDCEWWLSMMSRSGESGKRAVAAFRIMSGMTV